MPRIRTIKPEFWDSPGTAAASLRARLFYIAMWNWADDYGIGTANPRQLIGFAFPNDPDVTDAEFPRLCTEVADCFGVEFYTVNSRPYYAIPSWEKHQKNERRAKSRNPSPDQGIPFTHGNSASTHGSSGTGTGEPGNRGTGEHRPPVVNEQSPDERRPSRNGSALARQRITAAPRRTQVAIAIAEQFAASRESRPTEADLIAIGAEVTKALDDDIPPHTIAAGLTEWDKSDSWSPSQIGRFITKAGRRRNHSTVDANVTGWLNLATDHDTPEITA
ncbi:hypothetical protein E2F47_27795 [Mycobacterium eburneum]|nr:hypothetical protein [Mycobacterium eburneum]TDH44772.1 hypothetical protein E2F47_27795 [Mycobacterium eburneum]